MQTVKNPPSASLAVLLNDAKLSDAEKSKALDESEDTLLAGLVRLHIDACLFYRTAAASAEDSPEAENALHGLEKLHTAAVANLGAVRSGNDEKPIPALLEEYTAFRNMMAAATDVAVRDLLETAKKACDSACSMVLQAETLDLNPAARNRIAQTLADMQERDQYLAVLRKA
jgi:hypothetical protein